MSERPQAILVVGMHRSGTSAVTRALNLCGADLGSRMLPAAAGNNDKGFWEHADVVDLHERMLEALGRTWADPRRMPAGWLESPAAHEAKARIRGLVESEFSKSPLWVIKDPRICRFIPLWTDVLSERGIDVRFVFVLRDPREVGASLAHRDGMSRAESQVLSVHHFFEAAAAASAWPRSVVTFDGLLANWRDSIERIGRDLGIGELGREVVAAAQIDAFLDAESRHHRAEQDSVALDASLPGRVYRLAVEAHDNDEFWRGVAALQPAYELISTDAMPLLEELFAMVVARATVDAGRFARSTALPDDASHMPDLERLQFKMVRTLQDGVGKLGQASADLGAMIRVGNEVDQQVLHEARSLGRHVAETHMRLHSLDALAQQISSAIDGQRAGLGGVAEMLTHITAAQREQIDHLAAAVAGIDRTLGEAQQRHAISDQRLDRIGVLLDEVADKTRRLDASRPLARLRRLFGR